MQVLSALFRGKFLAALRAAHDRGELRLARAPRSRDPEAFDRLLSALYQKTWHVYAKRPFGGPEQVIRYLGGYTHRVGLSNRRLVSLDERGVTFRTKNGKTATLEPVVFLARFVEHVLPHGFRKVRHYGLLAPSHVPTLFRAARSALLDAAAKSASAEPLSGFARPPPADADWRYLLELITGIDLGVCRACGARAVERHPLPAARAPPAEAA